MSFVSRVWVQSTLIFLPAASPDVLIIRRRNDEYRLGFTWIFSSDPGAVSTPPPPPSSFPGSRGGKQI